MFDCAHTNEDCDLSPPLGCVAEAIRAPRRREPAALLNIAAEFGAGLVAIIALIAALAP